VSPPAAPQSLIGSFSLLTSAASPAKPTVELDWEASEDGTYVVQGYRILEHVVGSEDTKALPGGSQLYAETVAYADVEIGKSYEFTAVAVDSKGNSSLASAPYDLDLRNLEPALLAPRAPKNLTATSQRISVKLKWDVPDAWLAPLSGYKVYRGATSVTFTTATAYEDISPPTKVEYIYHVESIDSAGKASAPSLTVSAQATGAMPPSAPGHLSATVKPESVALAWDKSDPGTAPVTAYLLSRITEPGEGESGEHTKKFAPLNLSRTSYSEGIEGDHFYRYELQAADLEGNTSLASKLRVWVPSKPYNKTSILLMPTAYSNLPDRDTGFNVNVLFDLYIGELYETYASPDTHATTTSFFQPLQSTGELGVVTLDLKDSLVPETWITPAMSLGFYGAGLVPFGGQTSQQVAVSSSGGGFQTVGNLYAAVTKKFGFRRSLTVGFMLGNLSDSLVSIAPSDWALTLRHITPGGNYPDLFQHFVDPALGTGVPSAAHMLYAGLEFPFTVPFGFARWKTGLKLELMKPMYAGLVEPNSGGYTYPNQAAAEAALPLIWNFHIDNLPLFGFEFSVFQFTGGVEWIAFYHIPDLTWSF
jgi:hypothetical protein